MTQLTSTQILGLKLLCRAAWRGDDWGIVGTRGVRLVDRVVLVNERTARALARLGLVEVRSEASGDYLTLTAAGRRRGASLLAEEVFGG